MTNTPSNFESDYYARLNPRTRRLQRALVRSELFWWIVEKLARPRDWLYEARLHFIFGDDER